MEYVKRQHEPKLLKENKAKWTLPWVQFYRKVKGPDGSLLIPNKPATNYWTKDEIRIPLMKDFKNNCGFTGRLIPIPWRPEHQEVAGKGDVDHLIPKSSMPELVYEWTNYVWSSKDTNQLKGEFNSENFPILNPCNKSDCDNMMFNIASGEYVLKRAFSEDPVLLARVKNTEQKTMINSQQICNERRDLITLLFRELDSLERFVKISMKIERTSSNQDLFEFTEKSILDSVEKLTIMLRSESYKLLISKKFMEKSSDLDRSTINLLKGYLLIPQVPETFDE